MKKLLVISLICLNASCTQTAPLELFTSLGNAHAHFALLSDEKEPNDLVHEFKECLAIHKPKQPTKHLKHFTNRTTNDLRKEAKRHLRKKIADQSAQISVYKLNLDAFHTISCALAQTSSTDFTRLKNEYRPFGCNPSTTMFANGLLMHYLMLHAAAIPQAIRPSIVARFYELTCVNDTEIMTESLHQKFEQWSLQEPSKQDWLPAPTHNSFLNLFVQHALRTGKLNQNDIVTNRLLSQQFDLLFYINAKQTITCTLTQKESRPEERDHGSLFSQET